MIMSGPDDGAVFSIESDQFLIGNLPEAQVQIKYDLNVPPQGVKAHLKEKEVIFENRSTGQKVTRSFGEPYQVGQTWVAVFREEGGGGKCHQ
jgi:hypothetical protein